MPMGAGLKPFCVYLVATACFIAVACLHAQAALLTTGNGDATMDVDVDVYGSFGRAVQLTGGSATDAMFDPVGPEGPQGTIFESAIAVTDLSNPTNRLFMTTGQIAGTGMLGPHPAFTSVTDTFVTSEFELGQLTFNLRQSVQPLFTGAVQTGSLLTQDYTATNTSNAPVMFDLIRYVDSDIAEQIMSVFSNGGGLLTRDGLQILFATDRPGMPADAVLFVGITADGNGPSPSFRLELSSFSPNSGLRFDIVNGLPLDDMIEGDGPDPDDFVDSSEVGLDVTLALATNFALEPDEPGFLRTLTFFGSGNPEDFDVPPSVSQIPEPATVMFVGAAMLAAIAPRRRRG